MKPQRHAAYSTIVAGILYLYFKSWNMAAACLLSGVLIDLDHVYDYIGKVGFPFCISSFFHAVYTNDIPRLTLVFHSWELLFLIAVIPMSTSWNSWITGVLIGFGHHIVLDKINNGEMLRTYSFIWRWKMNFEFTRIFPNVAMKRKGPTALS